MFRSLRPNASNPFEKAPRNSRLNHKTTTILSSASCRRPRSPPRPAPIAAPIRPLLLTSSMPLSHWASIGPLLRSPASEAAIVYWLFRLHYLRSSDERRHSLPSASPLHRVPQRSVVCQSIGGATVDTKTSSHQSLCRRRSCVAGRRSYDTQECAIRGNYNVSPALQPPNYLAYN